MKKYSESTITYKYDDDLTEEDIRKINENIANNHIEGIYTNFETSKSIYLSIRKNVTLVKDENEK